MRKQKQRLQRLCVFVAVIVTSLVATVAIAAVTFDGAIHFGIGDEWSEAESTAVQDNYTGYGDQVWNDPAVVGSELDELYVRTDGTYLYVGVTGNLQSDGNAIVLLLDTDLTPGVGQNTLATEITPVAGEIPCSSVGPPFAVPNLGQALATNDNGTPSDPSDDLTVRNPASTGTVLDGGFEPDYAIAVDTFGGTVHVTQYDLYAASPGTWDDPNTNNGATPCFDRIETLPYYATRLYRGQVAVDSNGGALTGGTNPNGSQYAFNNQGTQGVTATAVAAPGSGLPGDPRTQNQGLEAKIHLADLGYGLPLSGDLTIRISVLLIGGGGLVSNQSLPGTARGTSQTNLGYRPDYTSIAGNQYATVTRSAQAFNPNIDGTNTVSEFGLANLVASQDTVTSFADRTAVCTYLTNGSELDELYLRTDGNYLYVGLTGNLEENGNAQIILLDIAEGGQNVLATEIAPDATTEDCPSNGPPGAVQGLGQALIPGTASTETSRDPSSTGTRLEAGFSPDYAITIDTDGGWLHVTQYDLSAAVLGQWNDPYTPDPQAADCISTPIEQLDYYATRVFRGEVQINSSSGALSNGTNPNGSEFAYNNTGTAGVTGESASAPPTPGSGLPGDPRSQTRGLEAKISLADLGLAPPISGDLIVKVAVLLTDPDGSVSNQTLPGIQNGNDHTTNLGLRPDFSTVTGTQFAQVTLTPAAFSATLDGRDIVTEFGTSNVVASQDTVTSFGDRVQAQCQPVLAPGSEINQIFVQDGADNSTIDIAITGNLEAGGNQLVLFLDTVAGGESILDANAGRIGGMAGDTIPLEADFALVVNIWQGTAYVDLINLQTNGSIYIGSNPVNSGEGTLDNGGAVPDWQVAISNMNIVGVNSQSADDPVNNPLGIQPNNAKTATTGFEISIPSYAVGSPFEGDPICLFAMITNSYAGWLSNQFLPAGLGGGRGNYNDGIDDLAAAGYTCLTTYIGPPPPSCPDPRYDADRDGDVDQADFAVFQTCYTGSGGGVAGGCECFDWNPSIEQGDGDVDAEDFGLFELCASGPGVPADKTCDDPLEP